MGVHDAQYGAGDRKDERPPSRARFESELTRKILSGIYKAGQKLPSERELAGESGLSRPVIREVISSLSERGLIEVLPARGSYVRAPDPLQFASALGSAALQQQATPRDVVEAREMIERKAVLAAATRATKQDVERLRELLRAYDASPATLRGAQLDLAFHSAVVRLSDNPVLVILFGSISSLVLEIQLRSIGDPTVRKCGGPIHHDIVDAIATGDAQAGAEAMSRHILLALELYGADLDRPLDDVADERLQYMLGRPSLDDAVRQMITNV